MIIMSIVFVVLFTAPSEVRPELTGDSDENITKGLVDFLGASPLRSHGPGGDPVLGAALLSSNENVGLRSSAINPSSSDKFLDLRLSLGSHPILQDTEKSNAMNRETGSTDQSVVPWSGADSVNPAEGSSSDWQQGHKPTSSREHLRYPANHEAMDLQLDENPAEGMNMRLVPSLSPAKFFWSPKTVKVMTETDSQEGCSAGLIEVVVEAAGGNKLKLRYPGEESLYQQMENVIFETSPKDKIPKPGRLSTMKIPFCFSTKTLELYFESLWWELFGIIISHDSHRENQTGMRNRYEETVYLINEALEQGKKELRKLGLPTTLYSEPLALARMTPTKRRAKPISEALPPHKKIHQTRVNSLERKAAQKLGLSMQWSPDSVGKSQPQPLIQKTMAAVSCTHPEKINQIIQRPSDHRCEKNLKPGTTTASILPTLGTTESGLKENKPVPALSKKKFDIAKSWISYAFPAMIHDIRVICEALPLLNRAVDRTIKELQWDAWHFCYIFINHIDFLYIDGTGQRIWETKSSMPHSHMTDIIDEIDQISLDRKVCQRAASVARKLLAFWMSCSFQLLYARTQAVNGLNRKFIAILNELYQAK